MSFANYVRKDNTTGQQEVAFGLNLDLENVEVGTLKVINNLTAPEIEDIKLELTQIKNDITSIKDDIKLELTQIKNNITSIKQDLQLIFNALNIDKNNKSIETNYSLTVKGNFNQG